MSFEHRCLLRHSTAAGVVTIVSAKYAPVVRDEPMEIVVDNNFFARVCRGDADFIALVAQLNRDGHRLNPLAACLEQLTSNREEFHRKYRAFRRNCAFHAEYDELPLGDKEVLALSVLADSYKLHLMVLRCYVLRAATILRRHANSAEALQEFRAFLSDQPICLSSFGMLLSFCLHVKLSEREFAATTELSLVTKFLALPQVADINNLRAWASNRASDLYLLCAATGVVHADSHLGAPMTGGVAVASSDQFVSNILFRYCCVGDTVAKPYAVDLDELVQLDTNLFDLLSDENMKWAGPNGGFATAEKSIQHYRVLWDKLALDAIATVKIGKRRPPRSR